MISERNKKIILSILYILFIIGTIILYFHHENWFDEVQAYLLCRDMNFIEILKNVHYEGHPFLYYLILYPFVKMGASVRIVNIFSLIFIYIALYFILFKINYKFITKICFLFSFPFLYQYSIIGRSYSLIVLLITLLTYFYSKKEKYPVIIAIIIGLLINTHLAVGGFCFIITIMFYLYELFINRSNNTDKYNKKLIIGLIIIIIFGVILILQFIPMLFVKDGMSFASNFNLANIIGKSFAMYFSYTNYNFYVLIFLVIIFFYGYLFINDKKRFLIFLFSNLYLAILTSYIWNSVGIHVFLVSYLFLIFIFNNTYSNKNIKYINVFLILITILSLKASVDIIRNDYNYLFSEAPLVSKYINNNISEDSTFFSYYDEYISSIAGNLSNYKFYHLRSRRYFTYVFWDKLRESSININDVYDDIDNNTSEHKYYIYIKYKYSDLCSYDEYVYNMLKEHYNLVEVYNSNNSVILREEKYIIYEIIEK